MAVMSVMKKICGLDKLHSGISYSIIGHEYIKQVSLNRNTDYVLITQQKCDQRFTRTIPEYFISPKSDDLVFPNLVFKVTL